MTKPGPVYRAKVGNVRVPVYRYSDTRFVVVWRQFAGAPRTRESFQTKTAAVARADELATALANSQADVVTLTSADRDGYRLAIQKLAPLGIPLHSAIEEYTACKKALPGLSLQDLVTHYQRTHLDRPQCPPADKVLAALVAQMQDDRRDQARYIAPLERDLKKFIAVHPTLPSISEEDVRAYLRSLVITRRQKDRTTGEYAAKGDPVSPRRRDNVRDAIVTLFAFAIEKHLPSGHQNPAEPIARIAIGSEITTYSPGQISTILAQLQAADADWVPWAAIAAFAGLRTSEIYRLRWEAFHWRNPTAEDPTCGTIAVSTRVAKKTREARRVPILPALASFLQPIREASGFLLPQPKYLSNAHSHVLQRLVRALQWKAWDHNALRHSFGSFRLAVVQSIDQVALEMGNSPEKVRSNYNHPKDPAEAANYFAVRSAVTLANILPMSPAKAGGH